MVKFTLELFSKTLPNVLFHYKVSKVSKKALIKMVDSSCRKARKCFWPYFISYHVTIFNPLNSVGFSHKIEVVITLDL